MLANLPRRRSLIRSLREPERAQQRLLRRYLDTNADTCFGREHRFASIRSVREFQERVPLRDYDELEPWIDRIRTGERAVLTEARVTHLVPSSGSAAARKLIPYTETLRSEFDRGIGAWIADLYLRRPHLLGGAAYWSITPPTAPLEAEASAVPIGFEADAAYLGGWVRKLVEATFAVRSAVGRVGDMTAFRYVTLLELLRCPDLALISVWHPSYLSLLFAPLRQHWRALLHDVATGGVNPPLPISHELRAALRAPADPRRAQRLAELDPSAAQEIWPRLALISCWGDAHAAGALRELARAWPGVELQAKGLLATEAFVTLPSGGQRPVAVESHFFEFLDAEERPWLTHELRPGAEYGVVVTTGGGLYRYRMRDRVRVDGFVGRTPSLSFLGKEDRVSDRRGEKLDDRFVAGALADVSAAAGGAVFAMLAPDTHGGALCYSLYLECTHPPRADLAELLERALAANPHYALCRRLGQLAPLRVFRIAGSGHHAYIERCRAEGQALGDVKPCALSDRDGWSERFAGRYLDGPAGAASQREIDASQPKYSASSRSASIRPSGL